MTLLTGEIISFKSEGFGFIRPDIQGPDIFVHIKQTPEKTALPVGTRVEFVIEQGQSGKEARELSVIND